MKDFILQKSKLTVRHIHEDKEQPRFSQQDNSQQPQFNPLNPHLPVRPVTAGEFDHNPPKKHKNNNKVIYICSFNVRTLSSPEKLLELKTALQKVKCDVLGLCEIRRLGEKIIEAEDYIMYYIGQTKGLNGVGFLVKKGHKGNIINFTGISERVCILEIIFENKPYAIIEAYSPTEYSTQEELEDFYKDLMTAHQMIFTKYII